eukprot:jgi/Mesvir1/21387/Mv20868-RA.1
MTTTGTGDGSSDQNVIDILQQISDQLGAVEEDMKANPTAHSNRRRRQERLDGGRDDGLSKSRPKKKSRLRSSFKCGCLLLVIALAVIYNAAMIQRFKAIAGRSGHLLESITHGFSWKHHGSALATLTPTTKVFKGAASHTHDDADVSAHGGASGQGATRDVNAGGLDSAAAQGVEGMDDEHAMGHQDSADSDYEDDVDMGSEGGGQEGGEADGDGSDGDDDGEEDGDVEGGKGGEDDDTSGD